MGSDAQPAKLVSFRNDILQAQPGGPDQQPRNLTAHFIRFVDNHLVPENFCLVFPGQMLVDIFLHEPGLLNTFEKSQNVHFLSGTDFHPWKNAQPRLFTQVGGRLNVFG